MRTTRSNCPSVPTWAVIPVDSPTVANALTAIIKHFGWQGNVGIGLPGQAVATEREAVNETVDETLDSMDLQIDKTFHESMYAMEDGDAAKQLADREEKTRECGGGGVGPLPSSLARGARPSRRGSAARSVWHATRASSSSLRRSAARSRSHSP